MVLQPGGPSTDPTSVLLRLHEVRCPRAVTRVRHHLGMGEQRIAFLLGAGASADARLPMSFDLSRKIVDDINAQNARAQYVEPECRLALNVTWTRLQAADAVAGNDVLRGIDVERLFAAVRQLGRRDALPISPFVSAWDPGVESVVSSERLSFIDGDAADAVARAIGSDRGRGSGRELVEVIKRLIRAEVSRTDLSAFERLEAHMIRSMSRYLQVIPSTPLDYLTPILKLAESQGPTLVMTLNYDRTVEAACAANSLTCETGFEAWKDKGAIRFESTRGIRLLKLHGSLDWRTSGSRAPDPSTMPTHAYLTDGHDPDKAKGEPVIIFGEGEKLRHDGPFIDLLREADAQLQLARDLVIVGYSFRDDHVNDRISAWVNGELARRLLVIDPSFDALTVTRHPAPLTYAALLKRHLGDRLTVWQEKGKDGLARLGEWTASAD